MTTYQVRHTNGRVVQAGERLTDFRGDEWFYVSCYPSRGEGTVVVSEPGTRPGDPLVQRVFYPSVLHLAPVEEAL